MVNHLSLAALGVLLFAAPGMAAEDVPSPVISTASIEGSHCLAFYGTCKYPANFERFYYADPKAPKGGDIKLAEPGTFDNLNMFILNGVKAPGLTALYESLMIQSLDEPQTMYGLIAKSILVSPDHASVEFTLRPEAKWQDGSAITADDVVFTFETLKSKGDPTYRILYAPITKCEKTGPMSVKFTFNDPKNRELPFIAGQMPILSKTYYATRDFEKTTLEAPMGSGPYKVASLEQGRFITYERDPNYWGKDLAINRGMHNFDSIRYDLYRDENVALEAFKAGEYDFRREYIARNWATSYDTPAVRDGRILKREIKDFMPQGMQAFIYNTRKSKFSDRRVREAIAMTLDYEWINKNIFYDAYERNISFFENTEFQATGMPQGKELELLMPYRSELPPNLFVTPFKPSVSDGLGSNRENLLKAQNLLASAGWTIQDGKCINARGEQLSIEFLLRQPTMERVIGPMKKGLERLGIEATIRMVDDAQYQKRTDAGDFDIVSIWINRGVFYPGNEQTALWHSSQADVKGGNNLGGVKNKIVDSLLEKLTTATDKDSLVAAGKALDRVLLWEHYVIPHWHSGVYRVAYWNKFGIPITPPKYSLGFSAWWYQLPESKPAKMQKPAAKQ